MCDEVERNRDQVKSELCPGIRGLLERLSAEGKLLGLATGNLERIGWIKVEAAGIREHFSFGAFADRHETREDIFRDAASQVAGKLGPDARLCFIGDTPRDVIAARAIGAKCIAVATGIFSISQLSEHSPDACIPCFSDAKGHP